MKSAKEVLESINNIDKKCYQVGTVKQFTIDMIEHFIEELGDCTSVIGEDGLPEKPILESLSYKVSTALEICDDTLPDFYILQELYDAINE